MYPKPKTSVIDRIIGRRIRAKRIERDISVPFMAEEIGVSVTVLQEFEAGTMRVSAMTLWFISGFLRVPVTSFFHGPLLDLSLDHQADLGGGPVRENRHATTKSSQTDARNDTANKAAPPLRAVCQTVNDSPRKPGISGC